ncbi:MAG: glycosyltransferase family 39 protein [Actinobacteria bacterium]|nr:glycosyltransferase family 39 protein [Actinomycetota bacterium]
MASRVRRVPAWAWLVAVVVGSFAVRAWLARGMLGPFIMVDELIYSELGRSLADGRELLVRDVSSPGYGIVYPALISPAYAVFEPLTDAYAAVKTLNALVMSLAAIPAYLLARRVVGPGLSLLAAVLAVSLPSLVYTGSVMTENAFYPVFLVCALFLTLVLERPTPARQVALLIAIGVAAATRVQAVVLVPALLTAPLLLVLFRREGLRVALRPFRWLYGVVLGAGALVLVAQLVRDRSLSDLLGAYSIVGDSDYELGEVLRYCLYHAAELDLYLGVVPVAATIVLVGRARSLDRPLQALLATALSTTFWLLLVVSAFASVFAQRIQERNLFVVVPLFLVLLLAWVDRGAPRPRVLAPAAAAVAAALILLIPFERFIDTSALSDTLMLLPWWSVQDHVGLEWIAELAFGLGLVLAALFVLLPRRYALALPLVVLAYYAAVFHPIWAGEHGVKQASAGAVFQGVRGVPRDWIDAALPDDARAAVLWTGRADRFTINQNEFFNRTVGPVFYLRQPTPGGVGETKVRIDPRDGLFRLPGGEPFAAEYLLTDGSVTPDGEVVERDDLLGTTLWQVGGNVVSTTSIRGLYPNDSWSGETVTWKRRLCRGGELVVSLSSDPSLFAKPQTVEASIGGSPSRRAVVQLPPNTQRKLPVTLPLGQETCVVTFRVSPTAVPADVLPGSTDRRELGAHFNAFAYEPKS